MKKKQLNALIDEYRATIESSPEKDFAKRERLADAQTEPIRRKRPSYKGISLAIAVCVVFAIILPIVIVLGIKKGTNESNARVFYANHDEIIQSNIPSIEAFNSANNTHIISLPETNNAMFQDIRLKESNLLIGVSSEIICVTEKYELFQLYIYINNYRIDDSDFLVLPKEQTVRDAAIKYNILSVAKDIVYVMEFEYDGYVYQAKVTCYNEVDIADIMADCFGL